MGDMEASKRLALLFQRAHLVYGDNFQELNKFLSSPIKAGESLSARQIAALSDEGFARVCRYMDARLVAH